MRSFFHPLYVFALISASLVAQNVQPDLMPDMPTREIIYKGIAAHDREHYDSALAMFNWVHPNDTNYSWAVAEKANTLLAMERYEETIDVCEKALKTPNGHMGSMFMTLGTAYDETERSQEALEAYDRGIAKAPMLVRLHFNKAVTHVRREEYQQAYEKLRDALRINPYHSSSHYLLGMLALEQGDWVPGALATSTYLMLEPGSGRSLDALVALNNALTEKTETKDYGIDFEENFRKVNLLVENYAAVRESYQVPGDLPINVIKQLHLIFKQMKINSNGFISNYYGPLFKDIVNDDKRFEAFSYLVLIPSKSEGHQKTIEKNIDEIKKFATWTDDRWTDLNKYVLDTLNGEEVQLRYVRYSDNDVQAIAEWDKMKDKPIGKIRIYDNNGVLATRGQFNKNGERTGEWNWFYANGEKREVQKYVNGKAEGEGLFYDMEGVKAVSQGWKDDVRHGKRIEFFPTEAPNSISTYTKGEFTGPYESFYPQGQTDYKVEVKEGKQEGEALAFYNDGSKMSVTTFKEGLRQGSVNVYYKNGQLKEENNYEDDVAVGDYKYYYQDGQLKLEGLVVKGKRAGIWKGYNPDGTLDYEEEYDESGKMTGVYRDYDYSGKIYHEIDYKKGEMTGYRYYDLEGNVIAEEEVKRDVLNFTAYHPNRVIAADGTYEDNKKEGNWIYYNSYGVITAKQAFSEGQENGLSSDFYKDGTFKSILNYKDGMRHGLYTEYYPDSTLYAQGRYVNNNQTGPWYYYNPDGSFRAAIHLADGKLEGWQRYYTNKGNLHRENYVRGDLILAYRFFGPNGDTLGRGELEGGTGTITWSFPNGQLAYSAQVEKGEYQGPIKSYYPNGKMRFEGQYAFDDAVGEWKWYHANGQLETVGSYIDDKRHGEWRWYYEDGTRSTITQYKYGDRDGTRKDFDREGNLLIMDNYLADELHGKRYSFGEDSVISLVRIYRYGVISAYTYADEDGNLKPEITIEKGNASVKSYYPNGKLAYDFGYKGGRYNGPFKRYFANGNLMHQSSSVGGRDEGVAKNYFSNGNVEDEANNVMGNIHGERKLYHKNGNLSKLENYVHGSKEGEVLVYDENGELTEKQIWFNNALFSIE
jgi:antitoxin component YwqK of YwqJK toxin-antitoxin module/cytochrome c-type biogenesis protein CcmH/NrfG